MDYVSTEELLLYCRAESDAEPLITSLGEAAEAYLKESGCDLENSSAEVVGLTVKALTLHYFDNPAGTPLPAGLQSLINQLKYTRRTT